MLNVVYAHLADGLDAEALAEFDRDLTIPYDWELSPFERRREEARRKARELGALQGQRNALESMTMPRGPQPLPGSVPR